MSKPALLKSATLSLSCKQCGTAFYRSPARQRGGFCSLRCFGDSKILPKKTCVDCGAVTAWGSNARCRSCWISHVSQANATGATAPCRQCAAPVYRSASDLKASSRRFGVFCGSQCFGLFVTGPNNPAYYSGRRPGQYPSAFKSAKRRVLRREGRACFLCRATPKTLDVHHIDRDKANNADWNLVALCRVCHMAQKGAPEQMLKLANQLYVQLNATYGHALMSTTLRSMQTTTTSLTAS